MLILALWSSLTNRSEWLTNSNRSTWARCKSKLPLRRPFILSKWGGWIFKKDKMDSYAVELRPIDMLLKDFMTLLLETWGSSGRLFLCRESISLLNKWLMKRRATNSLSDLGTQMMRWPKSVPKRTRQKPLAQCAASLAGVLRNALKLCLRRRLMLSNTMTIPLMKSLIRCKKETLELQNVSDGALGSWAHWAITCCSPLSLDLSLGSLS